MEMWVAVELRGGSAVQLVAGNTGARRVRLADPAAVARHWLRQGFTRLHVVDLPGAPGNGDNRRAVDAVVRAAAGRATLQIGGALRSGAAVEHAFRRGAQRVVLGARAVEDRRWLEEIAATWWGRVVVTVDLGGWGLPSRGWTDTIARDAARFVSSLDPLPLAAVLVTDAARERREGGVDADLLALVAASTRHPLIAAGGVTGPYDLAVLEAAGVAGVVVGTALYTGRITPVDVLALEESEG